MKILVFGGSGFVGSHVADELTERGHEVTIFDMSKSKYMRDNQKMIVGDFLDPKQVNKAVEGQDIVYNFAGIADLDAASNSPVKTIQTNVMGNLNVLEACTKSKVKRYIFASTLYVFSDKGSFYRCSKQACELIIEEYQKKFGLPFTILRYGSLYGKRADASNPIYRMIKDALEKKKIVRNGDGEELREYINVSDAARLSADILSEEYENEHILLSGVQKIRVKDLLSMVKEIMGNNIEIEYKPSSGNSDHYKITPFTFKPNIGKRLVSKHYKDLGEGILECLHEQYGKKDASDNI